MLNEALVCFWIKLLSFVGKQTPGNELHEGTPPPPPHIPFRVRVTQSRASKTLSSGLNQTQHTQTAPGRRGGGGKISTGSRRVPTEVETEIDLSQLGTFLLAAWRRNQLAVSSRILILLAPHGVRRIENNKQQKQQCNKVIQHG